MRSGNIPAYSGRQGSTVQNRRVLAMSEVPSSLSIACRLDNEPLEGAWVMLTLLMEWKNPIYLRFGPSDSDGTITISRDDLVAEAQGFVVPSPMDYIGFPGGWTGQLAVEV